MIKNLLAEALAEEFPFMQADEHNWQLAADGVINKLVSKMESQQGTELPAVANLINEHR